MLLNILHAQGSPIQQRMIWPKISMLSLLRNLNYNPRKIWISVSFLDYLKSPLCSLNKPKSWENKWFKEIKLKKNWAGHFQQGRKKITRGRSYYRSFFLQCLADFFSKLVYQVLIHLLNVKIERLYQPWIGDAFLLSQCFWGKGSIPINLESSWSTYI